ncbi:MAG: ATP-binding protein [Granulosicoccus sp.]|nr:ATP-binding protein [Granulosicoccus sp.]
MDRHLTAKLQAHFSNQRQMAFLSGPRQVGKTTIARQLIAQRSINGSTNTYLNWDNQSHRESILKGPEHIAGMLGLQTLQTTAPLCAFDELHKYRRWRDFLKGLFDTYENELRILVTGSARLDVFKRGGDSLMGRYFSYTLHPMSVAEINRPAMVISDGSPISPPTEIDADTWLALNRFGGFPEPLSKGNQAFYNRWRRLRTQQLFREDIRDLTRVQDIAQLEQLAQTILAQVGQLTSYTKLANSARVSVDTARRWIAILEALYWCFSIRPWHKNIARSLRKEPKYYAWDFSIVDDIGARAENLVASALLKFTHALSEAGRGDYGLYFLRDKDKREVDFLVTENAEPWFLVEVKTSGKTKLSPTLEYFQNTTGARHAFQIAMDLPYVERDCFSVRGPIVVPARTLLSQLV